MSMLLSSGLRDACVESCIDASSGSSSGSSSGGVDYNSLQWTNPPTTTTPLHTKFSSCMIKHCSKSEPTHLSLAGEWGTADGSPPDLRLDFVLVSPAVLYNHDKSSNSSGSGVSSNIEIDHFTENLSDHYPIAISWNNTRRR